MTLYAHLISGGDWFPIDFRPECDRTYFDPRTGQDKSLKSLREFYWIHPYYELITWEELLKKEPELKSRVSGAKHDRS